MTKYPPPLWLIVLIGGITLLSEAVYSPALPEVADALGVSIPIVENTLTIYLFGIACGILLFGPLSDRVGRKPCLLIGLSFYTLGCFVCYAANTIEILMIGRLIQAFGASVGSAMGQSIARDSYKGRELGKAYSVVGGALTIFPAIGPMLGGIITEEYSWNANFLLLAIFSLITMVITSIILPETHPHRTERASLHKVALSMICNKKVVACGLIIAANNGIAFGFFAEGSFIMIDILHMTPSDFGFGCAAVAVSGALGGIFAKKLHNRFSTEVIIGQGIAIILVFSLFLSGASLLYFYDFVQISNAQMIMIILTAQMGIMFGRCVCLSNTLAVALVEYKNSIGTSVSLFGFFYYTMMGIFTFGVGVLHDGTVLPMPFYFVTMSLLMLYLYRRIVKKGFKGVVL